MVRGMGVSMSTDNTQGRSRTETGAALWLERKKRRKGPPSGAVRLNWGVQETHAALPHGSPFHPAEICGEVFFPSLFFLLWPVHMET